MAQKENCTMNDVIMEIKDLSMFYGSKSVFKNIDLIVKKNSVTGIIGPSGCGKSSFIHCLNRMFESIPSAVVTGDILFHDKNIFDSRMNITQLRRKIGIVFQAPTPLPLSIETNISLPLREHGFKDIPNRIEKALKDVGLWNEVKDKLKSPANNLSGGQKQRLCLARTIALEPEVILMDEPCSSLDPISTDKIECLINNLKDKYTIIIITHNLAQAKRICQNISAFWFDEVLQTGIIVESGPCLEIFTNPKEKIVKEYIQGIKG